MVEVHLYKVHHAEKCILNRELLATSRLMNIFGNYNVYLNLNCIILNNSNVKFLFLRGAKTPRDG